MPRTRSSKRSADSPSLPARILLESGVATLSGTQPPVEDPVFVDEDEPRPEGGGHYLQMSVRSSNKTLHIECCSVTSINRC